MKTFDLVLRRLADRAAPCALIGAGALAIHGISRATLDVDLLTADRRVLTDQCWTDLPPGIAVDVRRGDAGDPLAGVVRVTGPEARPIDIVVGRPAWQADVVARAQHGRYLGAEVPVVSATDLVLLKVYAGGARDESDVRELLVQAPAVRLDVDSAIEGLPADMRARWHRWRDQG